MKVINLDHFVKSALVLSIAAFIAGCGGQPEEVAKKNPAGAAEEIIQSGDVVADTAVDESSDVVEEESLESILAKADEIIQRTGALSENVKHEPKETAANAIEETTSMVASDSKTSAGVISSGDGEEVVKATADLIRKIQQALADAGLNPGVADGKLGPRSKNALIDFQKKHGLAEGKITKGTLRELGIAF
ncbi:MAG: peptidoglycan-binding protein [Burkholderiales bacterium]|nr:peptidoglycan-binding protein [Burkholderiales bacterium]